jgi:hypothetical protein
VDWSDPQARQRFLAEIVRDAEQVLEVVRGTRSDLTQDSPEDQALVAAAELLARILAQDIERDELLAAADFGHGMAEFGDDGLAEFSEHEVDGERRTNELGGGIGRAQPGNDRTPTTGCGGSAPPAPPDSALDGSR